MERSDETRRKNGLYDRMGRLERLNKEKAERIKELEHKNQLLRITIAEALEECLGEDIVKATKILEQSP